MFRSVVVGLYGRYIFIYLRNVYIVFYRGCIIFLFLRVYLCFGRWFYDYVNIDSSKWEYWELKISL